MIRFCMPWAISGSLLGMVRGRQFHNASLSAMVSPPKPDERPDPSPRGKCIGALLLGKFMRGTTLKYLKLRELTLNEKKVQLRCCGNMRIKCVFVFTFLEPWGSTASIWMESSH